MKTTWIIIMLSVICFIFCSTVLANLLTDALIERCADVNIKAKDRKTAMDFALKNGHEETAELLREAMEKH